MATVEELLRASTPEWLRGAVPEQSRAAPGASLPRRAGTAVRNLPGQVIDAATYQVPVLRTVPRAIDNAIGATAAAYGVAAPAARDFWLGLTGAPEPVDGTTRATPARAPLVAPATPAPATPTPAAAPAPAPAASAAVAQPPALLDTDVYRVAAPALPTPARPAPAPERQTAFDISNSQRYMLPNQNTTSIPVPASLTAPAWGAGARPATAAPAGGPQVISVGNSGWMPDGALRPGSRNFNPVAFRAAARAQALNNQLALGQLQSGTQLDVANINAGAKLTAAQIGAGADMSRATLAAQAALQERLLANQGALATADLTGQYNLAGRQAGAAGTIEAARLAANARAYAAQLGADPEGDAAQAALRAAQANEILTRLGLVQQAREAGYSLHDLAALSRPGQQSNATPILDATGNVVGLMGPGGAIPLDENTDLGAYLRLRAVEQQLQTRR